MVGTMEKSRINTVDIPSEIKAGCLNYVHQEQLDALKALIHDSYFQPLNDNHGPYDLTLSIEDSRLVIRMRNAVSEDLSMLVLSLSPYRRLIQDYFLMIDSYERARHDHVTFEKLEAIDMGRRGLHNEGANILRARLKDKIEMDLETARRFFSLICLLTQRASYLS